VRPGSTPDHAAAPAWILWQRPSWRLAFVGIVVAGIATALPTGYLAEWMGTIVKAGADELGNDFNLSLVPFIGAVVGS
jgi:hypothetical protein